MWFFVVNFPLFWLIFCYSAEMKRIYERNHWWKWIISLCWYFHFWFVQGYIQRKTLIKDGRRPLVSSWQKYWLELWDTSLVYYLPKTLRLTTTTSSLAFIRINTFSEIDLDVLKIFQCIFYGILSLYFFLHVLRSIFI